MRISFTRKIPQGEKEMVNDLNTNIDSFEEFDKGSFRGYQLPVLARAAVFVDPEGVILVPNATYEILEKPDWVIVLIDKTRHRVALRKTLKGNHNAYKVSKTKDHARVSATKLTTQYKLVPKTGLYCLDIVVNDRTIIIDAKQRPMPCNWMGTNGSAP